jgi:pimeloyl-ACP methyl ester carboxylesterase
MTTTAVPGVKKSTLVRAFAATRPIRAAFRFLDLVAPPLAARWAELIWFTLPDRAVARAARNGHAGNGGDGHTDPGPGAPFAVEVSGHRVVGEAWGTGPVVYLAHGWAGFGRQLAGFVPSLLARGYRVVSFDAPSHGGSAPGAFGPRSSTIPEFAAALWAVVAVHGRPHAIIAHSLGCTATALVLCDGLRANRVALLAPLASPHTYARRFAHMLGFGDRTYRRLVSRVERRVGAPMRHFDLPALAQAVAMPPALVVHDRDDASTPVADGVAIAAAWPGSRLHLTSGLGHRRLLRDPAVIAEVVYFVARPS